MTKELLRKRLDDALEEYKENVKDIASDPYGKRPVTEGEMYELQKQIFYVLDDFAKAIQEYIP